MACSDTHTPEADGYCCYCRPYPTGGCSNPYHNSDWSDGYCPGCNRGRSMPPPMTEAEREAYLRLPLCPNEDCESDERWGFGCYCGPGTPYRRR